MRPKMILVATVLGGLLAASPAAQAHVLGYTFTEIYPPGAAPGTIVGSFSYGLNNLGQVVGGYQDSLGSLHGYIYTGGKYVTFDEPGAARADEPQWHKRFWTDRWDRPLWGRRARTCEHLSLQPR